MNIKSTDLNQDNLDLVFRLGDVFNWLLLQKDLEKACTKIFPISLQAMTSHADLSGYKHRLLMMPASSSSLLLIDSLGKALNKLSCL